MYGALNTNKLLEQ